jgi:rhodanese-related sulfurtransferase
VRALAVILALALWSAQAAAERFAILHVADLAAQLAAPGPHPVLYDANVESTRTHVGVIPSAHLLPVDGDVLRYLPGDKTRALVFYCANTYCTASHLAAERALDAGYAKVSVLVDGIYGWRDAKQPVKKIREAPVSMPPAEVLALQNKREAVVVDVREGEERHEIVDGALWIPMSQVNDPAKWAAFVRGLPRDKKVIFYCAMGVRSKRAAEMLREEGFATGYFEGPDQWRAAGLPVKPGPAR